MNLSYTLIHTNVDVGQFRSMFEHFEKSPMVRILSTPIESNISNLRKTSSSIIR